MLFSNIIQNQTWKNRSKITYKKNLKSKQASLKKENLQFFKYKTKILMIKLRKRPGKKSMII